MGDELVAGRRDADLVAGDAVELDRPVEAHAGNVRFDQIRVIEVAATEDARAGDARRIAEDVLVLHLAAELHTGRVGGDFVRKRRADEAEAVDVAGDRGDDAGRIAENTIRTERCGSGIVHAGHGAVQRVCFNESGECRRNAEAGRRSRHVVASDVPGRRRGKRDARSAHADHVVAELESRDTGGRDAQADRAAARLIVFDRRLLHCAGEEDVRRGGREEILADLCAGSAGKHQPRSGHLAVVQRQVVSCAENAAG